MQMPLSSSLANEASQLARTITVIAATVAVLVATGLPAGYFAVSYKFEKAKLESEAAHTGRALSNYIYGHAELWRYEIHRLDELIADQRHIQSVLIRIVDEKGVEILSVGTPQTFPSLMASADIRDVQSEVGRLDYSKSLVPVLLRTALVGLIGLVLAALILVSVRLLPLRALRRTFGRLEVSQAELRLATDALDQTGNSILITDNQGHIQYANQAFAKATGFRTEEALHQGFEQFFGVVEDEKQNDRVWDTISKGWVWKGRHRVPRKDGTSFDSETSISPVSNEGEEISNFLFIYTDITELKDAEEKLRENQQLLRTLLDTIPHWIYVKDTQSRYLLVNKAMADSFGVTPQSMIGAETKENRNNGNSPIGKADELNDLANMDRRVIESLEPMELPAFPLTMPDGNLRMHHIIKMPLKNDSGAAVGMVGISEDITQQKSLELKLREAQKMEAVGQLAGGIAHEFNNMLHIIINSLHIAKTKMHEPQIASKFLDRSIKSAERSAELTKQLLAYSRKTPLMPVKTDLNELITDLTKLVRPIIGGDIEIKFALADDLDPVVLDSGMIKQSLINLCINARDAMPDGGQLVIETRKHHADHAFCSAHGWKQTGDCALISISDNGTGMTPEIRERIFEPFFTTKGIGEGTGLGLAMVQGIIRQHNGAIEALSEPEVGSTFSIYLPGSEAMEVEKISPAVSAVLEPTRGNETILVAEDEEDVLGLLVEMLESRGYQVLAAKDGEEALSIFKKNADRINLVILDVIMPKLNGQEVYNQIRASNSAVPVLFCTGYSPDSENVKFASEGELRTIQKPYSPDVLFTAVREIINQQS